MPFWKRKKESFDDFHPNQLPPLDMKAMNARRQQEQQQENRKRVQQLVASKLEERQDDIRYISQARKIAAQMPEQGRTKKELLAVAFRQVRDSLNTKNTLLDAQFVTRSLHDGFRSHPISDFISDSDREAYLQKHRAMITRHIDKLETEAAQERQALAEKQTLYDTVSQRVGQIQDAQATREAELDQQLAEVRKRTQALQAQIAQRRQRSPTLPDPDLDRLETMLEELRRLKQ